jgi:hypothetical protein
LLLFCFPRRSVAALELMQWAPKLDAQELLSTLNELVAWLCAAADAAEAAAAEEKEEEEEEEEEEGRAAGRAAGAQVLGYMTSLALAAAQRVVEAHGAAAAAATDVQAVARCVRAPPGGSGEARAAAVAALGAVAGHSPRAVMKFLLAEAATTAPAMQVGVEVVDESSLRWHDSPTASSWKSGSEIHAGEIARAARLGD